MKAQTRIKTAIISLLVLANLLSWYAVLHIAFSNRLEVKSYDKTILNVVSINQILNKNSAKKLIDNLYNTPHIYVEENLPNDTLGRAIIMLRLVQIDKDLDLHNYIITYAHELTHIKYQVGNETWVSYETFITLYESANIELKYHALVYANEVLSGIYAGTEYDCGYYILEYLGGSNGR